MSGHSHWARIKRKKAVTDARRGTAWSKLARNVTVAARIGGGDPDMNPRLRLAIDKARAANMTRDTIEKAIKKGSGELEGETFEELVYEGYGPAGVAILCQAATDNRNRTAPEIKKIFERHGGKLGATNCVAWMFSQKGIVNVPVSVTDEDTLLEVVLEAGAEDVKTQGDVFEVTCEVGALSDVQNALKGREIPIDSTDISMVPASTIPVAAGEAKKLIALLEELDEHDDVESVSDNSDIPEEIMAQLVKD
ncbi:MAG: YebC/PmpR family DNA-binding transcriptional regulator [Phycisphaerales bacterium]|nr:MAG: YebC/PmpR family DNA-binding transcriptional regulator [Phycisphaerales bacterium]